MGAIVNIDQVRATVIEGTLENIRHRQTLLQSLHSGLRDNAASIVAAIQKDIRGSDDQRNAEAEAEFYLTMRTVKTLYNSLDFEQSIKQEYLVSNGSDNVSRSISVGLVAIIPAVHTRFNSIISPLATAITAGSCICLQLNNTLLAIDGLLKSMLPRWLNVNNINAFCISPNSVLDITPVPLIVDQEAEVSSQSPGLLSNPKSRTVALVDRTANLELAAKEVVKARFSFQGSSPYSPDVIVVNDFVKKDFITACVKHASAFFAAGGISKASASQQESKMQKSFQAAEAAGEISSFGSSTFSIVDIQDRKSTISSMKISGYRVIVLGTTSLIDSIMSQQSALLAAYIFADASTSKFVAQHLNAQSTYVNIIPTHLLIGPAAPITSHLPQAGSKYSTEMFSQPRPQYSVPPSTDLAVLDSVLGGIESKHAVSKLRQDAIAKLKPTGQRPGHAIGFFEQGILIGLGIFLTVAVPALGYGSWVSGRFTWRFVKPMLSS